MIQTLDPKYAFMAVVLAVSHCPKYQLLIFFHCCPPPKMKTEHLCSDFSGNDDPLSASAHICMLQHSWRCWLYCSWSSQAAWTLCVFCGWMTLRRSLAPLCWRTHRAQHGTSLLFCKSEHHCWVWDVQSVEILCFFCFLSVNWMDDQKSWMFRW